MIHLKELEHSKERLESELKTTREDLQMTRQDFQTETCRRMEVESLMVQQRKDFGMKEEEQTLKILELQGLADQRARELDEKQHKE